MKKLLLLLVITCGATFAKAQSVAETVEWLNVKRAEIDLNNCYSNVVKNGTQKRTLTITADLIKLEDVNGNWTDNPWSNIKDVKIDGHTVKIVFNLNSNSDGKPQTIWLCLNDEVLREKYLKAVKHLATLKGAKMVDNDLF